MNFFVHGFNSIMSIGDILVSGRPCRLMHFYQPFVVILAYVAFSAIYWAAGGVNSDGLSYIYPVLNWDNLSLTVPFVTIGMLIILPIVHALLWSLHQLRDYAVRSRMRRKSFSQTGNVGEQNPVFELAWTILIIVWLNYYIISLFNTKQFAKTCNTSCSTEFSIVQS